MVIITLLAIMLQSYWAKLLGKADNINGGLSTKLALVPEDFTNLSLQNRPFNSNGVC